MYCNEGSAFESGVFVSKFAEVCCSEFSVDLICKASLLLKATQYQINFASAVLLSLKK